VVSEAEAEAAAAAEVAEVSEEAALAEEDPGKDRPPV
jgi:hypothetical protein